MRKRLLLVLILVSLILAVIVIAPFIYLAEFIAWLRYGSCECSNSGYSCKVNGTCCRRGI